jgi:hypothetical protein
MIGPMTRYPMIFDTSFGTQTFPFVMFFKGQYTYRPTPLLMRSLLRRSVSYPVLPARAILDKIISQTVSFVQVPERGPEIDLQTTNLIQK